jgi:hypothetical protein
MLGVWIEPVTAQLMTTLLGIAMSPPSLRQPRVCLRAARTARGVMRDRPPFVVRNCQPVIRGRQ